jgi:hypothetical protein
MAILVRINPRICLYLIAIVYGCGGDETVPSLQRPAWRQRQGAQISAVELLAELKTLNIGNDLHGGLRNATIACRKAALDLPWTSISADLEAHGFRLLRKAEEPGVGVYEYIVPLELSAPSEATARSLYLAFWVDLPADGREVPSVRTAAVGVYDVYDRPYHDVIMSSGFRKDDVLGGVLGSPPVSNEAAFLPILKNTKCEYTYITDFIDHSYGQGFAVTVALLSSRRADAGVNLGFEVLSGLDGRFSTDGNPLDPNYSPTDTLGPPVQVGLERWATD